MAEIPVAVREAATRLLKDAEWLEQHGGEQDRQCIADVRVLVAALDAGARAHDALVALAVPCEALLRAEAAGEMAGMRPVLSDAVSKALKAGVILLRAALLPPATPERETRWLIERTIGETPHWLAWRGHDRIMWIPDATEADRYEWWMPASRDARLLSANGTPCAAVEHMFTPPATPGRGEGPGA